MTNAKIESVRSWSRFEGVVPVVSLPTVLLPHVGAPLELKATDARNAVRAAAREDRLICLRGAAGLSFATSQKTELATLAEVLAVDEQDATMTVLIKGLIRVEFTAAPSMDTEMVHVRSVRDEYDSSPQGDRAQLREQILKNLSAGCPPLAEQDMLSPALEQILPLGALCDVLADVAGLPEGTLHAVLQERNVDRRCQLVLERTSRRHRGQSHGSTLVHCN